MAVFAGLLGVSSAHATPPPLIGPLVGPETLELPEAPALPAALESELDAAASPEVSASAPAASEPVAGALDFPIYDPPTEEERQLVEHAVYNCDTASPRYAKPFLKLELLRLEREMGIPGELRGVTLAAWCGEAAYQTEGIVGDRGNAIGILQLHPHITSLCGSTDLRHDPIASARCWLWNLQRVYRKSRRRCRAKNAWKAAELWLSQGGQKSGYSCKRVSGHVARLERWQRAIERSNRIAMSNHPSR